MRKTVVYARYGEDRLREALGDSPVVLVYGPRQCGKTTLAKRVGASSGYEYFTFDDETTRAAAEADPSGFVSDLPAQVILDEIQRVPQLFLPIKRAVDRQRKSGRFLLTGSSNILLVPTLADSLAGRLAFVRLHPLAQCEMEGTLPTVLDEMFQGIVKTQQGERLGRQLAERIVAGGFPAAQMRVGERRRERWYGDYIETLVQRDARQLARITSLAILPRLLEAAAGQTARLVNISELSGPFHVSRPTIQEYVTLLTRLFLLEEVAPWHTNRLSRLIKTPKLHLGDTGVAASLLQLDAEGLYQNRELFGQLTETFVYQELARQASWHDKRIQFHHFRDRDGVEVDLVLSRGAGELVGVEVKVSATVTASDFRGLRKLRAMAGKRCRAGVIIYDGETSVGFGDGMYAIPIRRLWTS
ncbi:MAG: ATP-binding protein [Nitrospiraceae bacterium]